MLFQHKDGSIWLGTITEIWRKQLGLPETTVTFVRIALHAPLIPDDAAKTPFATLPGLRCQLVYAESCKHDLVVNLNDIVYHAALDLCPAGEFGISRATMIVYHELIQGRTIFPK